MATDFETTSAEEIQERLLTTESRRRPSAAAYLRYYLTHKPLGTVGFSIVLLMILLAIFAPLIAPYTYQEQNYEAIREAPNFTFFTGGPWRPHLYDGWLFGRCCRDWRRSLRGVGLRLFHG